MECWFVDLQASAEALRDIERATPRLSDWDRKNAAAFADAAAGTEWLLAHVALRILLERMVGQRWRGVPLERAAHSKPRLADAPVAFSLSHVAGLALIAVGPHEPIGVDLERTRAVHMRPDRRARIEAAAAELDVDTALPDAGDARFLQGWVRLEAAAKAQGCGIGRLLTRLGLTRESEITMEAVAARAHSLTEAIRVRDLAVGKRLFAAVATSPQVPVPSVRRMPATVRGLAELLG